MGIPVNRQQRRAQERKQQKEILPVSIPPIAPLSIQGLMAKHPEIVHAVEAYGKQIKVETSNDLFNTILGCTIIALHDKHNFNADSLNTLVAQVIEQMECISLGFVKAEDIIGTVAEIGIRVADMEYDTIKHGADEVKNRLKAYTEVLEEMSKMDNVFRMLNEGEHDTSVIADKLGYKKKTVADYKTIWLKKNLAKATVDDVADSLFGDDTEEKIVKGVEQAIKLEETPSEDHVADTNVGKMVEEITAEKAVEELNELVAEINKGESVVSKKTEETKGEVKMGLKKVVKVVEIQGEFTIYRPVQNAWDIEIDGEVFTLSREQMRTLSAEFMQVAEEEA